MTGQVRPIIGARPSLDILGILVAPLDRDEAIRLLRRLVLERRFTRIGFLNAHSANVACSTPAFAAVMRDFVVLPDGIGVDLAARILYGTAFPANLNGTDFVPALLRSVDTRLRVGLLGASRTNVERAARELATVAPQHDFAFIHDGYFDQAEEAIVLARLAEFRPDVLLVAMGVPRQELFIADKLTSDHCTMAIAVGALFDFLSGAVPRAPNWMRRARLEWLFRLWLEPGRLWRRYVVGNPLFLARVMRQKLSMPRSREALGD